jgi:hypothetical protein
MEVPIMTSTWRRAGLALGLSLSIFAAGCDDDDDTPTTPSSPAPQEPSPSPSPSASPSPSPSPSTSPAPPQQNPGDEVVFLGLVKRMDGNVWRIGSRNVEVGAETQFARGGLTIDQGSIQLGQVVRVRGNLAGDGDTVVAVKISIEENNNNQQ